MGVLVIVMRIRRRVLLSEHEPSLIITEREA